ncbi:MAG TPA: response regulator [Verrucomicrobiae bacterium]|jgi:HD-like signal output (HDOD) protein|nr:response regulator [Verrucomicrobiae bacterium]
MKKRILFVDDEPMVLQGLQRMLRPMRAEWDMEFLGSGEEALRSLEKLPGDVIVSDMRMPGMNGAELLTEVMRRFPTTVRLILSGFADKDLILKCVGSTHQYLSKPCDPDALKATIQRASNLEDSLHNERLKSLVCQLSRLPSIPSLYMEIIEKISRPETTLEDVGAIIARDVGMTAQILKLANSAFFGLRRQLASPEMAAAYLGLDTIKSLVLSIHAFAQFQGIDSGPLNMEALWTHSLQVAGSAKLIAKAEGADAKTAEEAFTAGMLHDLGKLVLAINMPKEFEQVWNCAQTEGTPFLVAEQNVFGANHADVGGYLIGLWGLPVPVVEAVALHHFPLRAPGVGFSPLTCVHAANAFEAERSARAGEASAAQLDAAYLKLIGAEARVSAWRDALAAP